MSTHAVIRVEGSNVALFKHWDGYPENTLPWLKKFNKDSVKFFPAMYPDHKVAELIRSTVTSAKKYTLSKSGWAVLIAPPEQGFHEIDAEFIYELKTDGSVSFTRVTYG